VAQTTQNMPFQQISWYRGIFAFGLTAKAKLLSKALEDIFDPALRLPPNFIESWLEKSYDTWWDMIYDMKWHEITQTNMIWPISKLTFHNAEGTEGTLILVLVLNLGGFIHDIKEIVHE
jgi:hypothetical protein